MIGPSPIERQTHHPITMLLDHGAQAVMKVLQDMDILYMGERERTMYFIERRIPYELFAAALKREIGGA